MQSRNGSCIRSSLGSAFAARVRRLLALTCAALCSLAFSQAHASLVISEIDPDQDGTDTAEFIELANVGPAAVALGSLYVVLVNGADDLSYDAFALPDVALAPGEAAVLGSIGVLAALPQGVVGIETASNFMQNGADAVALLSCPACTSASGDFPNDSNVLAASFTTAGGHTATRLDALVYGTSDPDDLELLFGLGLAPGDQLDDTGTQSLRRIALAGAIADAFALGTPTPGVLEVGVNVVPLPAAFWLFGTGLLGLTAITRRRRRFTAPALAAARA
jgi:Lamin Tail Domain